MTSSPFKFLEAFSEEDADLFFGREEETEALYEMTYDTNLMLLYGASGTGKTSLVQCGLASKFSRTRWYEISIRRERNINQSIKEILTRRLSELGSATPSDMIQPVDAIEQIHQLSFKPIYLIFDQFEELFTSGVNQSEQETFFDFIIQLLATSIPCKVIIVMREEFIADLWDFEKRLPYLFDFRYRLEKMRKARMETVIKKTLEKLVQRQELLVDQPEDLAKAIYRQLEQGKTGTELTYLQVYLDRLYQQAESQQVVEKPELSIALIDQLGRIDDVIGEFLDEQILELEERLGKGKEGIPIRILGALITNERTKKVLETEDLEDLRKQYKLTTEELEYCIRAFENMRILKRYEA